jgi:phosphoribosylglycinamide formyltransferase 1
MMSNQQLATGNEANSKVNIAIFASGGGSNAQRIIEYFKTSPPTPLLQERGDSKIDGKDIANSRKVNIALIVCNNPKAGVLQIAQQHNIPSLLIEKEQFFNGDGYLPQLQQYKIDFIVLAGFLWKIPSTLTSSYPKKISNIHPALLPKYGGKGMYGKHVHEAVIAANETQSGITIHYVDEVYDNGEIIFQATCPVNPTDTPQTLATKIHALEHLHYAPVIASILPNQR